MKRFSTLDKAIWTLLIVVESIAIGVGLNAPVWLFVVEGMLFTYAIWIS